MHISWKVLHVSWSNVYFCRHIAFRKSDNPIVCLNMQSLVCNTFFFKQFHVYFQYMLYCILMHPYQHIFAEFAIKSPPKIRSSPLLLFLGICRPHSEHDSVSNPSQRASNAANVSMWWRHHAKNSICIIISPISNGPGKWRLQRISFCGQWVSLKRFLLFP